MRVILLSLSGKLQILSVVGLTILLAFVIALCCGMFFDVHQLVANTDLISSVYQVMGTIYAILLTFTLWGVWQRFTDAGASVEKEVYALLDLVHMIDASADGKNNSIRQAALLYAEEVMNKEWQALHKLTNAEINVHVCDAPALDIVKTVQDLSPTNERDNTLFSHALGLLNNWLDARRSRLLIARGNSASSLWPLLFVGAIVLFAFHGLFVAKTLGIWITLLFGTALVIGVTFYLIFSLDCPFEGRLSVDSQPFKLAIHVLQKSNALKQQLY